MRSNDTGYIAQWMRSNDTGYIANRKWDTRVLSFFYQTCKEVITLNLKFQLFCSISVSSWFSFQNDFLNIYSLKSVLDILKSLFLNLVCNRYYKKYGNKLRHQSEWNIILLNKFNTTDPSVTILYIKKPKIVE